MNTAAAHTTLLDVHTAPGPRLVEDVIEEYFSHRIARAEAYGGAELWRRAAETTRGGKRLRPHLVLLAHDALGGDDNASAVVVAAAFEILHSALLIHDDVLDGDLVRRGRPNLAGAFADSALDRGLDARAAAAWGAASGLLAGDLLLSGVHALVARIDSPARPAIHELVDEAVGVTAAGEHDDVALALGVVPTEATGIRRMTEQKTAAYSFAAPLRAGAMLAGADRETSGSLSRIGVTLGLIYQLRDDVLGVFGAEERTGKSARGDLREGKRTLLVAFAADTAPWREVSHLFGRRTLSGREAARLRSALVTSGALAAVEELLIDLRARVDEDIEASGLPHGLRRELHGIAQRCAERDA